ncbi:RNA-binding component of cleavage and polyadenylation factor [Tulasnella sp. 424]|nr:RNA-binding component of cleavage and polyadenylation factor [Tulasnella sp. 424]
MDVLRPDFHQLNLKVEHFIKGELGVKLDKGPDCPRKHVRRVACKLFLSGFCPMGPDCPQGHPKPSLPTAEDYRPPSPPSPRDIGPPPPGFGRYFGDEGNQGGGFSGNAGGGGGGGFGGGNNFAPRPRADGADGMPYRRNLDEVTCFKCGQRGHYANVCKNPNVPGDRGGLARRRDFPRRED